MLTLYRSHWVTLKLDQNIWYTCTVLFHSPPALPQQQHCLTPQQLPYQLPPTQPMRWQSWKKKWGLGGMRWLMSPQIPLSSCPSCHYTRGKGSGYVRRCITTCDPTKIWKCLTIRGAVTLHIPDHAVSLLLFTLPHFCHCSFAPRLTSCHWIYMTFEPLLCNYDGFPWIIFCSFYTLLDVR